VPYDSFKLKVRDLVVLETVMSQVSESVEEYLETIYRLEKREASAKTSAIAREMNVKLGTVTNTIESLESQGLIQHVPYKGVRLTDKGERIALEVLRKHRLSERLLTDVLDMDWSEVHDAACRLEHGLTGELTRSIERTLGHPATCPHGNPIPSEAGRIEGEESVQLSSLKVHERAAISRISDERPEMLRYLASLGLIPGATVEVEERAPFDGPIMMKVMGASYALGRNVAATIWVKKRQNRAAEGRGDVVLVPQGH